MEKLAQSNSSGNPSSFISKVFEIFNDPNNKDMCGWSPSGQTIFVSKIEQFSRLVLPRYFRHSNFQSFVRQLNMYSFRKTIQDPKRGEFEHPNFKQDQPERLVYIKRKLNSNSPTLLRAKAAAAAAAAAASGTDEEISAANSLMIPASSASSKKPKSKPSVSTSVSAVNLEVGVNSVAAAMPTSLPVSLPASSLPASLPDGIAASQKFLPPLSSPQLTHGKVLNSGMGTGVKVPAHAQFHQTMRQYAFNSSNAPEFSKFTYQPRDVSDQFDVDSVVFDTLNVKNENGKRNANESSLNLKRSLIDEEDLDIDLELLMNMSVDDSLNDLNMEQMIDNSDNELDIDFPQDESASNEFFVKYTERNHRVEQVSTPRAGLLETPSKLLKPFDSSMMMRAPMSGFAPGILANTLLSRASSVADVSDLVSPSPAELEEFDWGGEGLPRKDSFSSRSILSDTLGLSRNNSVEDWMVSGLSDGELDFAESDAVTCVGLPLATGDC